jgi:hypothetical protein
MYIENNPLKFVRIGDFRDNTIKKMKERNIKGAYFGENYILTTSEESNEQVYDMLREFLDNDEEEIEEIKRFSIENIEEYVTCHYQQEEYEIFGVTGMMEDECENVMETIVCAFNDGRLSEEELSDWESLIDNTLKQHIMESVAYELESKIRELEEQKFNMSVIKDLFK